MSSFSNSNLQALGAGATWLSAQPPRTRQHYAVAWGTTIAVVMRMRGGALLRLPAGRRAAWQADWPRGAPRLVSIFQEQLRAVARGANGRPAAAHHGLRAGRSPRVTHRFTHGWSASASVCNGSLPRPTMQHSTRSRR